MDETLVYIIVFIGIVIYNVFINMVKAKKKEQEELDREMSERTREVISQSDDGTVIVSSNPLDTIRKKLEDYIESQSDPKPITQTKSQKSDKPKPKGQKTTAFLSTEEGGSSLTEKNTDKKKEKNNRVMTPVEEETIAPINLNFDDTDEVRRAFVYAEIFNRKY